KFSKKEREAINLRRDYSINQIEYCRNFIFRRNFPIHKIFERSCEMGLFRLAADKVAQIFGVRVTRRMRGQLYSLLDKLDHGDHVLRVTAKASLAACTKSSRPSCVWRSASIVSKTSVSKKGWTTWKQCARDSSPFPIA